MPWPGPGTPPQSSSPCTRNFRVKYHESSIEFRNLAYLQSTENKCKVASSSSSLAFSLSGILIVIVRGGQVCTL